MTKIIVEVSKYLLLFLILFFTLETFMVLKRKNEEARRRIMRKQIVLMLLFNFAAYLVMFLQTYSLNMIFMYLGTILYILIVQGLYRLIYKKASLILLNTMCMLLSVGFVIQSRLSLNNAFKQFVITSAATLLSFVVPVIVRKVKLVKDLTWLYGIAGILLLGAVFLFSSVYQGANLSLKFWGISFQFSEFVKITFVFFVAGMLQKNLTFRRILLATVLAAVHVGILVLSTDLGAALIYFITYIVMLYVATRKVRYVFAGFGCGALAAAAAYRLFSHVQVRVDVWRNPFADPQGKGYQIIQALFGICAGGWFGTGLFQGYPDLIPLASEDSTFAAICEELGVLFAICLLLLCMGTYLLIVNISMKMSKPFYKLIAIGLGTEYAFQVFLTVGGVTKFIPLTGVTLPLVSYGGSSMVCTILMLAIIQGLYILREDEGEQFEKLQRQKPKGKQNKGGPDDWNCPGPRGGSAPEEDDFSRRIEEQTEKSLNW
ncbi:MAG TPA: FtsW/RodA/SpoVE family cell cycle protein [Candidatus Scatomonas merdigallinarum]|nr:FtsW/RodA/SpoVE family cell cycle protein [Candidatus Scatomonas merdigallinarum]